MSALAASATAALAKSTDTVVGIILRSVGIKAYIKALPPASMNLLIKNISALPASQRKGAMIAGCSCWANGTPVDPANTDYAALLAKADRIEMATMFRAACHVNGYAELEFLKLVSPEPTAPNSIPAAEAPQAS